MSSMSSIHQEAAAEEGVAVTHGTKREGSSTQKSAQRQRAAEKKGVWSLVEFRSVITDKLMNAAEIFGASADQMATLLAVQPKIQFNIDKLTDGDRYEELAEAVEKLQTGTSQQLTSGAAGAGPTMCVACLEQEAIGLAGCGREHIVLCGPCAASYVESKMDESAGLPAVGISCPQVGCVERIDLSQCEQLLEKCRPDVLVEHLKRLTYRCVQGLSNYQQCPVCEQNVIENTTRVEESQCICGASFCATCGQQHGSGVHCSEVKAWLSLMLDDRASESWLQANTKTCPVCSVRIEKTEGCNHMTCKHCQSHWCFRCKHQCWARSESNPSGPAPSVALANPTEGGDWYRCPAAADWADGRDNEERSMHAETTKRAHFDRMSRLFVTKRTLVRRLRESQLLAESENGPLADIGVDPWAKALIPAAHKALIRLALAQMWGVVTAFYSVPSDGSDGRRARTAYDLLLLKIGNSTKGSFQDLQDLLIMLRRPSNEQQHQDIADGDPCWQWTIQLLADTGVEVFQYAGHDGRFHSFDPSEQVTLKAAYNQARFSGFKDAKTVVLSDPHGSPTRSVRITSSWMVLVTNTSNGNVQVPVRLQVDDAHRPGWLGRIQSLQHVSNLVDSVRSRTTDVEQSFASSSSSENGSLAVGDRVAVMILAPQPPFTDVHHCNTWLQNGVVVHVHQMAYRQLGRPYVDTESGRSGGFDIVLPNPLHSAAIEMVALKNLPRHQLFRVSGEGQTYTDEEVAAAVESARRDEQQMRNAPPAV